MHECIDMPSRKRDRKVFDGGDPAVEPCKKKREGFAPAQLTGTNSTPLKHAVLDQYFTKLLTLRDYVLLQLPSTSRIRRRKIAQVGSGRPQDAFSDIEHSVGALLDGTLVGFAGGTVRAQQTIDDRWQRWTSFTQKGDESHVTLSDDLAGVGFSQSEVQSHEPT